jgi:hypothetical protein
MDRRNFLRSILGVAAATALPSEVWPFRKIFLPLAPQFAIRETFLTATEAITREYYSKHIPPAWAVYDAEIRLYVVDGGMVANVMKEFNRGLDKIISEPS